MYQIDEQDIQSSYPSSLALLLTVLAALSGSFDVLIVIQLEPHRRFDTDISEQIGNSYVYTRVRDSKCVH